MRGDMPEARVSVLREIFAKLDKTGDGVVTVDDLRPWFPPFSSRYGVSAPNLEALARDA